MNDLGAVNLAALEELAAGRERKGFLDAQSADLEEAVTTLEDAIRRIDRETRELLRQTFESVNRHFGRCFRVFGGVERTGDDREEIPTPGAGDAHLRNAIPISTCSPEGKKH